MTEIWKDIEGYKGLYQVSSEGRVRSLNRIVKHRFGGDCNLKGKLLVPIIDYNGYLAVQLYKEHKRKRKYIHRLVAEAFIPNPDNLPIVNHKSENKSENFVENLEWVTAKENVNWGTGKYRSCYKRSKTVLQYTLDGKFVKEWKSTMEVQRQLGYTNTNISLCCLGKCNSRYGYVWKYKEKKAS